MLDKEVIGSVATRARQNEKTAVIESRTNIKVLASLLHWFKSKGILIKSKSQLVNYSLTMLLDILSHKSGAESGECKVFESSQEALNYLSDNHIFVTNKTRAALAKQIAMENTLRIEPVENTHESIDSEISNIMKELEEKE